MTTVLAFIFTLSILIAVHEFGHFWIAKRNGIKVLRFAIGFGKPLWRKEIGADKTEFALCMLPLGGYVKMLDEREAPVSAHEVHRAFNRQSVWVRMKVVLAGPAANFLLAIVLYSFVMMSGVNDLSAKLGDVPLGTIASEAGFKSGDQIQKVENEEINGWESFRSAILDHTVARQDINIEVVDASGIKVNRVLKLSGASAGTLDDRFFERMGFSPLNFFRTIDVLLPGGVAEKAGLKVGDEIVAINHATIASGSDLINQVRNSPGRTLLFTVKNQNTEREITVIPASVGKEGAQVGRLGVSPTLNTDSLRAKQMIVKYGPVNAVLQSLDKTWRLSKLSIVMMWKMLTGTASLDNLGGTLTIAKVAGEAASYGIIPFVEFLCFVSIGLGVLNLLPVPVLDGGHFMYYVAEVVKGSPVSIRTQEIGQYIGGALLLTLMTFALYNDIQRLFLNA